MAFSISVRCSTCPVSIEGTTGARVEDNSSTSHAAQPKLTHFVEVVGKLAVILDNIEEVIAREEACKLALLGIPQRSRNNG